MACAHSTVGLFLDNTHETRYGTYRIYRFACDLCPEATTVLWRPDEDEAVRSLIREAEE